jgi:hypothetical protein
LRDLKGFLSLLRGSRGLGMGLKQKRIESKPEDYRKQKDKENIRQSLGLHSAP